MLKSIINLKRVLVAVLAAFIVLAAMPIVSFSAGETGGPVVQLLQENDTAAKEEPAAEEPTAPKPSAIIFSGGAIVLGRPAESPIAPAADAPVAEAPAATTPIITSGAMVIGMPAAVPAAPDPIVIETKATAYDATPTEVTSNSGQAAVPYSAVATRAAKKENSGGIVVPTAVVILPYVEPVIEEPAEVDEPPMAPLAEPPAKEPEPIVVAEAPKAKVKKAAAPVLVLSDGEVPYGDVEAPGQGIEDQLMALGMGLAMAVAGILVMKRLR